LLSIALRNTGLVGSTEWVEENLDFLSSSSVAYLNVDVGTTGPHFKVSASPVLNDAIYKATGLVLSPNQTVEGQTVRDVWDGSIRTMGSGSDFTAFQDFAGVPSLDYGFSGGPERPVWQYHSNYDSFHWMERFGDPSWQYHIAMAKVWALTITYLSETPVIPFKAADYAVGLGKYLNSVKEKAASSPSFSAVNVRLDLEPLEASIADLHFAAIEFDAYTATLTELLGEDIPWWEFWKKVRLLFQIRAANDKYKMLERKFLHQEGLDGRDWFKHVVFAPGLWTGYSGATFPGLVESLDANNITNAEVRNRSLLALTEDIADTFTLPTEMA
jgi:N-acetylated-alpha-linked acidic dipeptidase